MGRNIEVTILEILNMAKEGDFSVKGFNYDLERVIRDSRFTAPEMMYIRWREAHEILCAYLLNKDGKINDDKFVDVKLDILSLFSTRDKEELRLLLITQ